jgi:pimeloyl-ACP methyl ester carboxylesterase
LSAPILLLHGQPGGVRDWDRVVAALGPATEPIAVYRPGWDGRRPACGLADNAGAAAAELSARGIGRATVVGHSLGAGVAARLAVARPELVNALVLVAPGVNTAALDSFDRLLAAPGVGDGLSAALLGGAGFALGVGGFRRAVATRLGLDESFLLAGGRLLRRPAAWRAFVVEQRALFAELPVLEGRLGEIAVPTTIVAGSADRVVPPAAARRLAAQIPEAKLVMIDGAGHLLPHQHARVVADAVRSAGGVP